jgi:uncharacterized protein YeaO (DUF488 family)
MVYTSYYSNIKKLPSDKYILVGISATVPNEVNCLHYKKLAPSYENLMCYKDGKYTFEEYKERYIKETLSALIPIGVITEIKQLLGKEAEGKHIVLLSYDKDAYNCHRSVVANWLSYAGTVVKELIVE